MVWFGRLEATQIFSLVLIPQKVAGHGQPTLKNTQDIPDVDMELAAAQKWLQNLGTFLS